MQSLIHFLSAHPHIALAAVFAASLLESLAVIGTVIPGSTIVFAGGVLIGLQVLGPWSTAAPAITGAILGDGISYWLGHRYHERIRIMWPMSRYPALFDRGQAYFDKNGGRSVFLGRFLGPLRAIVPVIAGMSNMAPSRFYAMNVLSAVAWSAAHILPGVLFGASLQLAGAVSSRLAILLVSMVVLLWAAGKLARWILAWTAPRIAAVRDRWVARARRGSGLPSRAVLSLFDRERPESQALLTAAVLLIGAAWLFLGVLEDVVAGDPLVELDRSAYAMLQGLRTSWADNFLVAVMALGGATSVASVVLAVSALLLLERCWRTLGYWLAAAGFAEILVWVLKTAVGRARPNPIYSGMEQFSFPSGHAAMGGAARHRPYPPCGRRTRERPRPAPRRFRNAGGRRRHPSAQWPRRRLGEIRLHAGAPSGAACRLARWRVEGIALGSIGARGRGGGAIFGPVGWHRRGDPQRLAFVKVRGPLERIVIRLWATRCAIGGLPAREPRPLWNAMVTSERLRRPAGLMTISTTSGDFAAAAQILAEDTRRQRVSAATRERDGFSVLLLW